MNVLIATYGSYGDVHPFVGVALALRGRGHDVAFISNPYFRGVVERVGLRFVPAGSEEAHHRLLSDPGHG